MFKTLGLEVKTTFEELAASVQFESISKGREAAILVQRNEANDIPIIRDTTKYTIPPQNFQDIHSKIAEKIGHKFNNILFEIYDNRYKTMAYHSDQELDLQTNSIIALYSCYLNPETPDRKLFIKNKETGTIHEILLRNNSVVLFNTTVNSIYLHKIVLADPSSNNKWLGLTFRQSKTYISKPLRIASESEKVEFYKLRSQENRTIGFKYPELDYTIS